MACNIVKHRDFYPTKEVLLKHSMSYLGMMDEFKGASACASQLRTRWGSRFVCAKSGLLWLTICATGATGAEGGGATNLIDVPEDFVRDMGELSKDEQALVIKVLVLCSILDGRLRGRERKLYEQVLAASDESFANNQQRIKQLATRYRTMVPVTLADFDEIIELSALPVTPKYYCNECLSTCALVMAC